jgi:hypothetical protein
MIIGTCDASQHRNIRPVYESVLSIKPDRYEAGREISLTVHMDIVYTKEDNEIIRELIQVLDKIRAKIPKE